MVYILNLLKIENSINWLDKIFGINSLIVTLTDNLYYKEKYLFD